MEKPVSEIKVGAEETWRELILIGSMEVVKEASDSPGKEAKKTTAS